MHGALIKSKEFVEYLNFIVLNAKCKTYEGQSGIVVLETLKTFKIITEEDKLVSNFPRFTF